MRLLSIFDRVWEQIRSAPATMALCASWVVIYAIMALDQGSIQIGHDWLAGGISPLVSDRFGHLTMSQLLQGQIERPLTATFIHYSLIHLGMNLIGLYVLGPLIESWYGSGLTLTIYVVIGFFGNLLASLGRMSVGMLRHGPGPITDYPCGGGSSVICGMVALLAVVGWRMRSRFGNFMRSQMVLVLLMTAGMGVLLSNVDNFGHAGGAIIGALLGLTHGWLVRCRGTWRAVWFGTLSCLVLVGAVAAQIHFDRVGVQRTILTESRLKQEMASHTITLLRLGQLDTLYLDLARRGQDGAIYYDVLQNRVVGLPPTRLKELIRAAVGALRAQPDGLDQGTTGDAYRLAVESASRATIRAPFPNEIALFRAAMRLLVQRSQREIVTAQQAYGQLIQTSRRAMQPPPRRLDTKPVRTGR